MHTRIRHQRLIPAHAGKTHGVLSLCQLEAAHPRSRGENVGDGGQLVHCRGSSPLTRGKRHTSMRAKHGRRLIPAHAGKTRGWRVRGAVSTAHPRSRGENHIVSRAGIEPAGSSPLTRGKLKATQGGQQGGGLIPAHAGKTQWRSGSPPGKPAHPRSRGENAVGDPHSRTAYGSSPLTRGKPACPPERGRRGRLIPAHAGKTVCIVRTTVVLGAHPRSRGENRSQVAGAMTPMGSSPLTRGKPCEQVSAAARTRLIPAHAGKTWTS